MSDYIEDCPAIGKLKARITSPYGIRIHPVTGEKSFHSGIDIVKAENDVCPITAVENGVVVDVQKGITGYSETQPKGNYVRLRHVSGRESLYLHLKEVYVVMNQQVKYGEQIGYMGATGRVTGAHLHFQVYSQDGDIVDPEPFIRASTGLNEVTLFDIPLIVQSVSTGLSGASVVILQRALSRMPEYHDEVMAHSWVRGGWDGVYGKGLAKTVAAFQRASGLIPTGDCDSETAHYLNISQIGLITRINTAREDLIL